jgi:BON domain
MANLITSRPRVRGSDRGRPAGERFARALWGDGRGRARSRGGPAATMAALFVAGGIGALAEYFFFDRQHGARRRHIVRDRTRAALRRRSRDAVRRAKYLEGVAEGVAYKAAHAVPGIGGHKEPPDDVTLAQKVESIAFRKAGVPKGRVSVNSDNAVIYLRGQLESDGQIEELVRAIHAIEGVNGVKNLLHTRNAITGRPSPGLSPERGLAVSPGRQRDLQSRSENATNVRYSQAHMQMQNSSSTSVAEAEVPEAPPVEPEEPPHEEPEPETPEPLVPEPDEEPVPT